MNHKHFLNLTLVAALTLGAGSAQAAVMLFEYGINIDGAVSFPGIPPATGDPVPSEADISAFNEVIGLGRIGVTVTGIGSHYVGLFVDHEIDEAVNTFFNEVGAASGTPAAAQSWEIDEPGYVFGDIFDNFLASALDNANAVPAGSPDDVSMALGWDFTLAASETASIDFLLATTAPTGGFYLIHDDPDSANANNSTVYFSSQLTIRGDGPPPLPSIPEPSLLYLLGVGLLGIAANRRSLRHRAAEKQGT